MSTRGSSVTAAAAVAEQSQQGKDERKGRMEERAERLDQNVM